MKNETFEDFLRDIHARIYEGLDDDMPDAFNEWLSEQSVEDIILFAEDYGKELRNYYSAN